MSALRLLIFDGDDTLWDTMTLYIEAKATFSDLLAEKGIPPGRILSLFESIDLRNVEIYGFSRSRFPESMVETYRRLCAEVGRQPDTAVAQTVREIGDLVFARPAKVVDSAVAVLGELKNSYELVLFTKGDTVVQETRLHVSGLKPFFTSVYITPKKGKQEFATILSDRGVEARFACSVGNSLRSDINPALDLGMFAIFVPQKTWVLEEDSPTTSDQLIVIDSLALLPAAVTELDARIRE